MERTEIEEVVRTLVARHLGVDETQVGQSDSFLEDLGADSLDAAEVVREVEDKFSLEVPGSDFEHFDSLGQIVDYLSGKLGST